MNVIVSYKDIFDKYFPRDVIDTSELPFTQSDLTYVFDEFLRQENVGELTTDLFLDRVLDTQFYTERSLQDINLGFIAEELYPAIINEFHDRGINIVLDRYYYNSIKARMDGVLIELLQE